MNILAINFNHDGSAVLLSDGQIAAYVNTERFSRKKKHPGIREADFKELLCQAGLALHEIDVAILCNLNMMDSPDIPLTYGTNLKETWLKFYINNSYTELLIDQVRIPCIINPDHHLLHSSLAWFTSPYESGMVFSWDPTGYAVYCGRGNRLVPLRISLRQNSSILYDAIAKKLFRTGIFGAGKLMGLAPYGKQEMGENHQPYSEVPDLKKILKHSHESPIMVPDNGGGLNATLAYDVQWIMEQQLCSIVNWLYEHSKVHGIQSNLCLAGGAALNSVANQVAFAQSKFEKVFVHPASGDDGTAIGAALWYWHICMKKPKGNYPNPGIMYSVRKYDSHVHGMLKSLASVPSVKIEPSGDYIAETAGLIAEGKIIGWFQGASEIGPRSLGNRSILADPRQDRMKDILNSKVKFRESFRPFAPSVLNQYARQWFDIDDSPFMLRVSNVLRPTVPAITHVDGSARIQTVTRSDNEAFFDLISHFHQITGTPMVLNTSFNIKGEPIVETPEDAINCFLHSELDHLVFPGVILSKNRHPSAPEPAALASVVVL